MPEACMEALHKDTKDENECSRLGARIMLSKIV